MILTPLFCLFSCSKVNSILANHFPTSQSACMKSTIHLCVWCILKQFILTIPLSITRPVSIHKKHYSPECVAYSKTIYSHSASVYNQASQHSQKALFTGECVAYSKTIYSYSASLYSWASQHAYMKSTIYLSV